MIIDQAACTETEIRDRYVIDFYHVVHFVYIDSMHIYFDNLFMCSPVQKLYILFSFSLYIIWVYAFILQSMCQSPFSSVYMSSFYATTAFEWKGKIPPLALLEKNAWLLLNCIKCFLSLIFQSIFVRKDILAMAIQHTFTISSIVLGACKSKKSKRIPCPINE